MKEIKSKQVGDRGFTYHVTQFGAKQGGRVMVRLLKMVGAAAGGAMSGDGVALSVESIGALVTNLAESVSEADYDYLCDVFAKETKFEGGELPAAIPLSPAFDQHFAGQYKELGLWLLFAIEVNYDSFLPAGGIAKLRSEASAQAQDSAKANEPAASKSRSPNISATTGPSGA